MATATADRAGLHIDETSSFGRYRLSFDQAASNATKTNNLNTSKSKSATTPSDMAQAQRPSSGQQIDQTASVAPSRLMSQDHNQGISLSPAPRAPELAELTSNPILEGILGPNKDGRVRNPVPSKLKGKTDNKQGNFGVMHMGTGMGKKSEAQGRDAAAERDAAARRTSENTASHAKAMMSEKYVPPKKRGIDPSLGAHLLEAQAASRGSPFAVSRAGPSRPLAPDETKQEQARLLTLLRSINPITVVDQICKAVAYFGGIPGAPPPEDGIFPESANTRETGALFIGWLAEIFPDLSARSAEVSKDTIPNGGKKKGRPSKMNKPGLAAGSSSGEALNEHPNSRNGYGYGPAISAPTWGLPPPLVATNTPVHPPILPGALPPSVDQSKHIQQQSPNTPANQYLEDQNDSTMSASKRRRGRPKGSTNKKKAEEHLGLESTANGLPGDEMQGQQQADSPEAQVSVAKVAQMSNTSSTGFTPVQNNQAATTKPVQPLQYSEQSWQLNAQQNQTDQSPSGPDEFSPEERAVLEAFRHNDELGFMPSPPVPAKVAPEAGQKRKRALAKPKVNTAPVQKFPTTSPRITQNTLGLPTSNNDTSMGLAKDALQCASVNNPPATLPPAKRMRNRKLKAPAAIDPPTRTQTTSVISSAISPIPASTILDSQATASQQSVQTSIPVARPPVEGLEAHYERGLMASLQQQQQNGRSHTPTIPQVLQVQQIQQPQQILNAQQQVTQHVRQQSKPSPSPLHQSIPQTQTQQMQHQKSQSTNQQNSGLPRDDQNPTQSNSARPSSTGYYNQRNQTSNSANAANPYSQTVSTANTANVYNQASSTANTANTYNQALGTANTSNSYSQQYPTHQPSQLYANHQPSPQMSNSNSYRSSSTHTLAQSSPQFTQPENAYRTASPHTISQPSPSFTQPDTTARSTNTYGLTQPSPSFTQAESSYRTPSTHAMAQSTPSYTTSRSHTQTQQASHQNPYTHFPDSSFIDLPTLDSLGHTGTSNAPTVGLSAGYGQALNLSNSRSSASNNNSLYGSTSGLGNGFDAGSNDLLRSISRTASHSNSAYGPASSLNAFDSTASEYEMRERMMRGLGRR